MRADVVFDRTAHLLICDMVLVCDAQDAVQSPVVSALSLTRLQLSGTSSLFLSAILPLAALLNFPGKPFSL